MPILQREQLRPGWLAASGLSPHVLAPLSFMFQGLPGPVGDPGPKGSRVSEPWQVPYRWALEGHYLSRRWA